MRLTSLSLEHFRSYDRLDLRLPVYDLQLFIGCNGAGKTNLIEAISFLSIGRSCLRAEPSEALRWGEDFFRIRAESLSDSGEVSSLEYVWQRAPRKQSALFIRDVRTPLLQFIGALPTIVFLPQDLDIFTGAPSHRRAFLDMLLSQLKPDFAASRIEFERILKQRNAVLSAIGDGVAGLDDLALWDSRLASKAARLILLREEVIRLFGERMEKNINSLGEGTWTDACMIHDRKTTGETAEAIEEEMIALLLDSRNRDLALRTTTVGPHRDDWHLRALGRDIAVFASRGQQRSAFIALLLTSAALLKDIRGERPVILLDDVLSELDDAHQHALLSSLSGHQVFITTTHPVNVAGESALWNVSEGTVTISS